MLGNLLHEKPDELRADVQQVYGLDVDRWRRNPIRFATLAAQLPPDARVNGGVGYVTVLLHNIEYEVRVLAWQRTKDGEKGRNRPKPVQLPGIDERKSTAMTVDDFERFRQSKIGG